MYFHLGIYTQVEANILDSAVSTPIRYINPWLYRRSVYKTESSRRDARFPRPVQSFSGQLGLPPDALPREKDEQLRATDWKTDRTASEGDSTSHT